MNSRFDYFKMIENKYKSKISLCKPVVIRLDGKNVCKNEMINILDESQWTFSHVMKRTAEYISNKYQCYVYISSDEFNIIFLKPYSLYRKFKSIDTQKIVSLISQEVFFYFNKYFKSQIIYFDARMFNIEQSKIKSYILYRRGCSINVLTRYYAKHTNDVTKEERKFMKFKELDELLSIKSKGYDKRTTFQREGLLYAYGDKYKPLDFLREFYEYEEEI